MLLISNVPANGVDVIRRLKKKLIDCAASWLNQIVDDSFDELPMTDFERLCEELHPGDVILVAGKSRISRVIRSITFSHWTHSTLYIGRLVDIRDKGMRDLIAEHYTGDIHDQLLIEALLNEGTIITPVNKYEDYHLRLCRPKGISKTDRQKVIEHGLSMIGNDYDLRHLLDLARFLLPITLLPRRWRSTIFSYNAGIPTRNLCSNMLGEAFATVSFPVLPVVERLDDDTYRLYRRNPKLMTPKDFDYSPYFDIIKYPYIGLDEIAAYRTLPWDKTGMVCNRNGDCFAVEEVAGNGDIETATPEIRKDSAASNDNPDQ